MLQTAWEKTKAPRSMLTFISFQSTNMIFLTLSLNRSPGYSYTVWVQVSL